MPLAKRSQGKSFRSRRHNISLLFLSEVLGPNDAGLVVLASTAVAPMSSPLSLEVFDEPEGIVPESVALMRVLLRHCPRVSGVSFPPAFQKDMVKSWVRVRTKTR
jgi:hypothetical protein